jgi:hypothetical protein
MYVSMGKTKEAVFPDPVSATPMISVGIKEKEIW